MAAEDGKNGLPRSLSTKIINATVTKVRTISTTAGKHMSLRTIMGKTAKSTLRQKGAGDKNDDNLDMFAATTNKGRLNDTTIGDKLLEPPPNNQNYVETKDNNPEFHFKPLKDNKNLISSAKKSTKFEDEYRKDEQLGKGGFGIVWRVSRIYNADAQNPVPQVALAAKEITKARLDQSTWVTLRGEVRALEQLHHRHIIHFFDVFEEPDRYYILMEYIQGPTLNEVIAATEEYSEDLVKEYMFQILQALKHCKERGVVHRDIKPGNILVTTDYDDKPLLKLIDFGFSHTVDLNVNSMDDKILNIWCGTSFYLSPEMVQHKVYNYKTDVWSIGVVLYELLSGGYRPFEMNCAVSTESEYRENKRQMFIDIWNVKYDFSPLETWEGISADAKDLISKMLVRDLDRRYSPVECLDHPWMKEKNKKEGFKYRRIVPALMSRRINATSSLRTLLPKNSYNMSMRDFVQASRRNVGSLIQECYESGRPIEPLDLEVFKNS